MKFKRLKSISSYFILIALLSVAAFAQQPSTSTPSINRLQQVISYLASDALEGRCTGTAGANDAAHYIAGEFSLLGLRPGMQMARPARTRGENRAQFLQPFPYVSSVELGKANQLSLRPGPNGPAVEFYVGEDWMPLGFSSIAQVENSQLVYAGWGITSSDLKYDDYARINVRDKVAIVLAGTPDGDNPHGRFAQFESVRFKAIVAREHGAKALMILSREKNFREDRLYRLRYDNASSDASLPVFVASNAVSEALGRLGPIGDFSEGSLDEAQRQSNEALRDVRLTLSIDIIRRESPSFNVVGILPGSDPKLKNEAIVIGAHYDHLGRGGEGSLAPREGDVHHGADDNASGVAGLLELARIFSSQKPRRSIVFIAFSGEEEGLIGSNYYVNHPIVPLANTIAMINMDMIGRLKERKLIVGGVGTANEWRSMIDRVNTSTMPPSTNIQATLRIAGEPVAATDPKANFLLTLNEDGYGPSDHQSFYIKQVPVLFFWTGNHDDYHKPSDTANKINYEGEARVISFIANVIRDIDRSDKRPTYTVAKSESQGRTMGFRVYLGTIPNYADSNDRLKLDGVRDGSPAAKAGLKAGDTIVKMAGHEVKNIYDYTYALGEMKAGQEYEVEIVRGSEKLTLRITPAKRQ